MKTKVSGETLRKARDERGWTQETLGAKIGIERSAIARLERSVTISEKSAGKFDKVFGSSAWRALSANEDVAGAISSAEKTLVNMVLELLARVERLEAYAKIVVKPRYTAQTLRSLSGR